MFITLRIAVLLLASTFTASAQSDTPQPRRWEFRLASGSFVPTGDGRDVNKQAQMSAAQLSCMSGYKPLVGIGKSDTHNDIVFMAALRLTPRRAAQR